MYPLFLSPPFYLETQDMTFCLIGDMHLEERAVIEGQEKSIGSIRFLGEIGQNVLTAKLCYYAQRK